MVPLVIVRHVGEEEEEDALEKQSQELRPDPATEAELREPREERISRWSKMTPLHLWKVRSRSVPIQCWSVNTSGGCEVVLIKAQGLGRCTG